MSQQSVKLSFKQSLLELHFFILEFFSENIMTDSSIELHSFQHKLCDTLVDYQVTRMSGQTMIWVGAGDAKLSNLFAAAAGDREGSHNPGRLKEIQLAKQKRNLLLQIESLRTKAAKAAESALRFKK